MTRTIAIHTGFITHNDKVVFYVSRDNKQKVLQEINWWFFDYHYARDIPFVRIPPLDDWTRSADNPLVWTIKFPSPDWELRLIEDTITI